MGLDMYLYAVRRPVPDIPESAREASRFGGGYWANWAHTDDRERAAYHAVLGAAGLEPFAMEDGIVTLEEQEHLVDGEWVTDPPTGVMVKAGYWRKANAIHGWFVREVQAGADDCGHYSVHLEQLAYLRKVCAEALEAYRAGVLDRCVELLPPVSGFFFGPTDVDEYWAEDLADTIRQVERVITAATKVRDVEIQYHANW